MATMIRILQQVDIGDVDHPVDTILQQKIGGVGWQNVTQMGQEDFVDYETALAAELTAEFAGNDLT